MSVHFNFVLSDIDASNLIDILHSEAVRARVTAAEFPCDATATQVDIANHNWYNAHADYLDRLKQQVLAGNTRV